MIFSLRVELPPNWEQVGYALSLMERLGTGVSLKWSMESDAWFCEWFSGDRSFVGDGDNPAAAVRGAWLAAGFDVAALTPSDAGQGQEAST